MKQIVWVLVALVIILVFQSMRPVSEELSRNLNEEFSTARFDASECDTLWEEGIGGPAICAK